MSYSKITILLFIFLTALLFPEEYEPLWQTRTENIRSTEFSKSGDVILVDTWDDITLIRTSDGEIIKIIPNVHYPKYSSDGSFFYFLRGNKVFKADSETYEETELFEVKSMHLTEFIYSQDLKYLIHPLEFDRSKQEIISRGIDIYDLVTGELYRHIDHSVPASKYLDISSNNRYLTWRYHNYVNDKWKYASVLYDIQEKKEVELETNYDEDVNYYKFGPSNFFFTSKNDDILLKDLDNFLVLNNLEDLDIYTIFITKWINEEEFMYSNIKGEIGIFNSESFENEIIETFHEFEGGNPGTPKFNFKPETGQFCFETSHYIRYYEIGSLLNIENENIYELTLSPNPVKEKLNISFQLEKPEQVELFITDLLGNRVDLVQSGFQSNLKQNISYPIADLPTGTYILTLSANGVNESVKFIKE